MKRALIYLLLTMIYMSAEAQTCTHEFGYGLKCRLCGEKQPTTTLTKNGIYQLYSNDDSQMLVGGPGAFAVSETTNEQPNGFHGVWYITIDAEANTMCLRDADGGKYLSSDLTLNDSKVTMALTTDKVTIGGTDYYLRDADCDAYALKDVIKIDGDGLTEYTTDYQDIAFVVKNLGNMQYLSIANEDFYKTSNEYGALEHYQKELNRNTLFKFYSYYVERYEETYYLTYPLTSGVYSLYSLKKGDDGYYHNDLGINEKGIFYYLNYDETSTEESSWIIRPIIIDYDTELKNAYNDLSIMYESYKAAGVDLSSLEMDDASISLIKEAVDALTGAEKESYSSFRLSYLSVIYKLMFDMCHLTFSGSTMQNMSTGKYLAVNRDDCYSLYGSDKNTGLENQFELSEFQGIRFYNTYSNEMGLSVSPVPSESGEYYLYAIFDESLRLQTFTSPLHPGYCAYGADPQYYSPDNYINDANSHIASFTLTKPAADSFLGMNDQSLTCGTNYKNAAAWWKMVDLTDDERIQMKKDYIEEMITEVEAAYADPKTKDITDPTYVRRVKLYRDEKATFDAEMAAAKVKYDQGLDKDYTYDMYLNISSMMEDETSIPSFYENMLINYPQLSDAVQRLRHASDGHYIACSSPTDGKSYKVGTVPLDLFDANQITDYDPNGIRFPNGNLVTNPREGTINYADPDNEYSPHTITYSSDNITSIPTSDGDIINYRLGMRLARFTPNAVMIELTNPMRPQLVYAEKASSDEGVEMKYVEALPSTLQGDLYQLADCYWQQDYTQKLKIKMNTVGNDAWATTYQSFNASLPKNVDAYTAEFEQNDDKTAVNFNLYKIRNYGEVWNDDTQANERQFFVHNETPVILHAPAGTTEIELGAWDFGYYDDYETFYPRYHGFTEDPKTYPYNNNVLKGILQNTMFDESDFKRDDLRILSQKNGVIGFYAPNSSAIMLKQNKVYVNVNDVLDDITLSDGSQAKEIYFNLMEEDGTVTRIRAPFTEQNSESTDYYNLMGQKLNAPQQGINIINGKKVLVK